MTGTETFNTATPVRHAIFGVFLLTLGLWDSDPNFYLYRTPGISFFADDLQVDIFQ